MCILFSNRCQPKIFLFFFISHETDRLMMERITYVVPCTSQEWPSVNYIVYTSKKSVSFWNYLFWFFYMILSWYWFWALITYIIEIVNIILSTPSSYIFPLHIGLIRHVDKITALLFFSLNGILKKTKQIISFYYNKSTWIYMHI